MDQKNDPKSFGSRNVGMLTLEPSSCDTPNSHARHPRSMARKKVRLPKQESQQISDQTSWMLAVRDARDRQAFGRLFDYYAPRLKGFVMRTGVPAAQAEDIVQEVMISVWHKAAQFDPHRAQVSSWIYQIARNRQIDVLRKENRPMPEELMQDEVQTEDASQIIALEQEADTLRQALNTLKPGQRDMVEKAYLGELSHSEIQEQTGLPLGTIKSRIRLGLEKLRHELKDIRQS